MEIRKPKFKTGQIVIDKKGDVGTVINVSHYYFDKDEYWYNIEKDETIRLKSESNLEPYQEKPKSVWDLQNGDTYYVVDYNDMNAFKIVFYNDEIDLNHMELGNCFLTKEEAESELERVKIEAEMIRLGGTRKINELNSNVVHTIQMHFGLKYVYVRSFDIKQAPIGVIFFNYRKQAIKALETIGKERIKKYIFGVDE